MRWFPALLVLSCLLATPAAADPLPPVAGSYHSIDYGGAMLTGRFSESWVDTAGAGGVGNTLNARSWGGSTLGGQWAFWCMSIDAPPLLIGDTRDTSGTGLVTWETTYSGGLFRLGADGPWSADNLVDFTGTLNGMTVTAYYSYDQGAVVSLISYIETSGLFDQLYPSWDVECMQLTFGTGTLVGTTDQEPKPSDYPDFLDPALCPSESGVLTEGSWGTMTSMGLGIFGCGVTGTPATQAPPLAFTVLPPAPNPVPTLGSEVQFWTDGGEPVVFGIYDLAGKQRRTWVEPVSNSGWQRVRFFAQDETGRRLPNGVYFLTVETARQRKSVKLTVVR